MVKIMMIVKMITMMIMTDSMLHNGCGNFHIFTGFLTDFRVEIMVGGNDQSIVSAFNNISPIYKPLETWKIKFFYLFLQQIWTFLSHNVLQISSMSFFFLDFPLRNNYTTAQDFKCINFIIIIIIDVNYFDLLIIKFIEKRFLIVIIGVLKFWVISVVIIDE